MMAGPTDSFRAMFPEHDWDSVRHRGQVDDFNSYEDLMNLLLKRRKEKGITQTQLAEHMLTKQSAVSDIESMGSTPRIDTLQRYARAVGYKIVFEIVPVDDEATLDASDSR